MYKFSRFLNFETAFIKIYITHNYNKVPNILHESAFCDRIKGTQFYRD